MRIAYKSPYAIDPVPSAPGASVEYVVNNLSGTATFYTENTRTTINAAGFQSVINGDKYLEVKNGTELTDYAGIVQSNYSVGIGGDLLLKGLIINNPNNVGFIWKYYPSLIAQGIFYSTGGSPLVYKKMNGAFPFVVVEHDGISSIVRNSTGVFTVTLKNEPYNDLCNVVVSGAGETLGVPAETTKFSVGFTTPASSKKFVIRCVRSNTLDYVDPFTINIAVFGRWDVDARFD
jgi:hypothetical protein